MDPSALPPSLTMIPSLSRFPSVIENFAEEEKTEEETHDTKSLREVLHIATHGLSRKQRPYIVGHRGALYTELENTIPAFRACANSCDAVELDVFKIKDNSLVVFHGSGTDQAPGRLEDYCGVEGSILDLTLNEARALRFKPNFKGFVCPTERIVKAESIPTLEEVLVDIREHSPDLHVKIELKGPDTARPVIALVERLGMVDQCSYSSFDHSQISIVREMRPQVNPVIGKHVYPTGALFNEIPPNFLELAKEVGADELQFRYDTCTVEIIEAAHQANMGTMAWMRGPADMDADTTLKYLDIGNEDESCYDTILATGVQQLCINKPDVLHRMFQESGALGAHGI